MAAGAVIAAAAAGHRRAMTTVDGAWASYAAEREMIHRVGRVGWAHVDPSRVDGRFDGVVVAFELAMVGNQSGTTALAVPLAPLPLNLEITREGLLKKIARLFGAKDLALGDDAFDPTYFVRATNEEAARALLTRTVREELLALGVASLAYDDGTSTEHAAMIVLSIPRLLTAPEEIDRMLQLLVTLSRARPEVVPFR